MIYIRADANPIIGMGHIMRCLSIAEAAASLGREITFVLADDNAASVITDRGFQVVILHTDYTRMEDEIWPPVQAELIIVDSYYVTPSYFRRLKRFGGRIAYIDDLASQPFPVDILVNYNIYGPYLNYQDLYKGNREPKFILGSAYAPLRKMFRGIAEKEQKENVKDILISTGGADHEHIALKIIQAQPKEYTYHILLGKMNQDKDKIKKLANENIILHENVADMKSLISNMDIAVSAAGSTLYEICACGVPLITYAIADNQIPGTNAFAETGLAINLGDLRGIEDAGERILSSVDSLARCYKKRVKIGRSMQDMIDGFGANRIVDALLI